ncbi:ubiquitin carboxyl-terminal hydrolase 24-like [Crassostrea virginica]
MLGHLQESKLQYHEPECFWKVFKLWGQTVNIREQQDAFDFFQALIDQIDEHLKKNGKTELFKRKFQGIFSDQKICKDCPHRFKGDLDSNSFMELTELVHKGEKKGIFMDEMPASIHQIIQSENLTFVKNRDVYNTDYFRFIRDLVAINMLIQRV